MNADSPRCPSSLNGRADMVNFLQGRCRGVTVTARRFHRAMAGHGARAIKVRAERTSLVRAFESKAWSISHQG